jgi:cell division protein DivIC
MLSHLPSWLKNKYFLATAFFISWMLFFDHNDLFLQRQRANELAELKETKAYYQSQIDQTRKDVEEIRINTASLEKIAREKYMMKKDNEELFIIPATKK